MQSRNFMFDNLIRIFFYLNKDSKTRIGHTRNGINIYLFCYFFYHFYYFVALHDFM